jgi:hypothetical protein
MNFQEIDIQAFLKASLRHRFLDISPYDFEDFIAQLFKDNAYQVEQTSYSSDYGADLIIEKFDNKIAVQVKRYAEDTKVSVSDMNQVLGAREYYQADNAMMICTSTFTQKARALAEETEVLLFDWERLFDMISETYLDGQSYYEFYGNESSNPDNHINFEIEITDILYEEETHKGEDCTVLHGELHNLSGQNLNLFLQLPSIINGKQKQIGAIDWLADFFVKGVLYNGASVEFAAIFKGNQLGKIKRGDHFLMPVLSPEMDGSLNLECTIEKLPSDCFMVTFCFGRASKEYQTAISFRDKYLYPSFVGRKLINTYYAVGPKLKKIARKSRCFTFISTSGIIFFMRIISVLEKMKLLKLK